MTMTNTVNDEVRYYHLFFVFSLRNYNRPITYHLRSNISKDTLYRDSDLFQSTFETLQKTCQNKINFVFYHIRSSQEDPNNLRDTLPILKTAIIMDVIEDMVYILQKELEEHVYETLPTPAIGRKCNHLVLNMYTNKDIKFNVVDNSDLIRNYIYNTLYRFGRLIYTDGIRTYNGCVKSEYLEPFDNRAKQFFDGYGRTINLSRPTIPYK